MIVCRNPFTLYAYVYCVFIAIRLFMIMAAETNLDGDASVVMGWHGEELPPGIILSVRESTRESTAQSVMSPNEVSTMQSVTYLDWNSAVHSATHPIMESDRESSQGAEPGGAVAGESDGGSGRAGGGGGLGHVPSTSAAGWLAAGGTGGAGRARQRLVPLASGFGGGAVTVGLTVYAVCGEVLGETPPGTHDHQDVENRGNTLP